MNDFSSENSSNDNADQKLQSADLADDELIPELTIEIPVVDQIIPELTDRIDLTNNPSIQLSSKESTETIEQQLHRNRHEVDAPSLTLVHPVTTDQVGDNELEIQQWQIEQQALTQAEDWQQLAKIESIPIQAPDFLTLVENSPQEAQAEPEFELTEEIQIDENIERLLDASWQKLESLIMEKMPVEIAGPYLQLLEQQIENNKQLLAESLAVLEQENLNELYDFYKIEPGF